MGVAYLAQAKEGPADQKRPSDINSEPTQSKLTPADRAFLEDAIQGNKAEIALGQLAQEKSQTDSVKQYGQLVVEHHTKLNEQFTGLANTVGVPPPAAVSKKQQATADRLAKISDAKKFDKEFIKVMISDHQANLRKYERMAKTAKNAELKKIAGEASSQIKEHLDKAKQIQTELKGVAQNKPLK
jgi:putative membrane protein